MPGVTEEIERHARVRAAFITSPSAGQLGVARFLSHVNNGAILFKANFIHECLHHVDSTAMS